LPDVVEAAAVSVADSDGVDAVAFFYVAKPEVAAQLGTTLQSRVDALPHYQRPRWLHVIAALPRTATGKLMRRRLQELHGTQA
jgi:long-chain acyl-CoA synthetase